MALVFVLSPPVEAGDIFVPPNHSSLLQSPRRQPGKAVLQEGKFHCEIRFRLVCNHS
ncbi:hypothetical protein BDA96_04G233200 [Sorghum bicolor]|uniref:Uncharacterized protein n=2 Tax=Sorghum bicolor TaxID=4558 RepID=A0A921R609_SORBI|nr:hypothetical protein BDA96_04G233200 [Sorghum bicolor]KXG30660.1 hypothetical protein SORBI_3004G219200 [Sorghum bicolor]